MHHQKLDVLGVADEESLVAGGHHVAGLLVGAIANLQFAGQRPVLYSKRKASHVPALKPSMRYFGIVRTEGMAMVPRKRRRTRESIPLGFRQLGSTHLKRSLW